MTEVGELTQALLLVNSSAGEVERYNNNALKYNDSLCEVGFSSALGGGQFICFCRSTVVTLLRRASTKAPTHLRRWWFWFFYILSWISTYSYILYKKCNNNHFVSNFLQLFHCEWSNLRIDVCQWQDAIFATVNISLLLCCRDIGKTYLNIFKHI